ncbi:YdcF family protein [Aliikangiella sp. G2MR2-5]|uniref:YdcF family protein n=1 Tax=Aliikangiella sp. G2MR2-5 TaxID=2788943 RepID=UPI0018AC141C|nr:YdcF family protein [Aliikangiella sp. G2MR2-5]
MLIFLALLLLRKFKWTAITLCFVSLSSLLVFSLPPVAASLIESLESYKALTSDQIRQFSKDSSAKRAIIVLGGGRKALAPEYGDIDTVNAASLERIRYASWLSQKTQIPVLVTGGSVNNEATSEAVLMNQVMAANFGTASRWIESKSKNTWENAQLSSQLLFNEQVEEVILVTHAWHMRRAVDNFRQQGLKVIPAPMGFETDFSNLDRPPFIPSSRALATSSLALEERLKLLWLQITQ